MVADSSTSPPMRMIWESSLTWRPAVQRSAARTQNMVSPSTPHLACTGLWEEALAPCPVDDSTERRKDSRRTMWL